MTSDEAARHRVDALIAAAKRIADPLDPLGVKARAELPVATGLSPEGVDFALGRCLETHPEDEEVRALVRSVPRVPGAHVLLSANVFVAAHRAVALALAASADVVVRPSRREPTMVRLLERAAPGLFRIAERLEPRPGDHVWAYGEAETLEAVRRDFPDDVVLHGHGPGIGIVFVDAQAEPLGDPDAAARAVADDVVPFDQRGCLSPRVVFVLGESRVVRSFAEALARALGDAAARVPLGRLDSEEIGETRRYRDAMLVAGAVLPTAGGIVGLDVDGRAVVVPPPGRNVHVMGCTDPESVMGALGSTVTTIGVAGGSALRRRIANLFPHARVTQPGAMQTPPFDGPADRRNL